MIKYRSLIFSLFAIVLLIFLPTASSIHGATFNKCGMPVVVGFGTKPNVMFLMDYSGSMQFAANYPLVDEDFQLGVLPKVLKPFKSHLYGLLIKPERLHEIRQARRPDSEYASLVQCQYEVKQVSNLLDQYRIPSSDVTLLSIEEISTRILTHLSVIP